MTIHRNISPRRATDSVDYSFFDPTSTGIYTAHRLYAVYVQSSFNKIREEHWLNLLAAIRASLSAGVKCENLQAAPNLHAPTTCGKK